MQLSNPYFTNGKNSINNAYTEKGTDTSQIP